MGALLDALQYAVIPIFAFPVIGYIMGLRGTFSRAGAEGVNNYAVNLALPSLLFLMLSQLDFSSIEWRVMAIYLSSEIFIYALSYLLMRRAFKLGPRQSLLIGMTSAFPNHVLLIAPILSALYGPEYSDPVAIMIAFDAVLIFGGTIVILEVKQQAASRLDIAKGLANNRMLQAITAGLTWNFMGGALHEGVHHFLSIAATTAPPASLFALGVILSGISLRKLGGPVWTAALLKDFAHPAFALIFVAGLTNLSDVWSVTAPLIFAAPCGAMAFVLGLRYKIEIEVVAKAIVVSTVISMFTIAALA
ncbi:MAG: AEC family transporter [Pikeienuella sp.]